MLTSPASLSLAIGKHCIANYLGARGEFSCLVDTWQSTIEHRHTLGRTVVFLPSRQREAVYVTNKPAEGRIIA